MSVQQLTVAVLVVLAAAYVVRSLAPRRWLRRLGIGRHGGSSRPGDGSAGGGSDGCRACSAGAKLHRARR
ncbi:MAG: hypothetical protein IT480_11170 [Gammaproteobacteria bacterium]|nr:hypothetical protein [Gammaproteobacteria bacterium]